MPMPEKFLKPYDAQAAEPLILKKWEDSGYANPDRCIEAGITKPDAEVFSIVLPPPNVTGILHMGSALMLAIEDVVVRFERMRGKRVLWIPGTDSAAIATQAKVEKDIQKSEGKSRHDLGREELLRRIDTFVEENKNTIISQFKAIGASLDWSRYAYTMDAKRYAAVMEAFVRMYNAGLIYRGNRIVNWDPKGQTTISDDEIVYEEEKVPFYYFTYGPFTIGTVRPETKFGDKYVVMHPDDARYANFKHGDSIDLEWINGPITATVIKDTAVDPEAGSGVMTITPAHSLVDFEIAQRHGLDIEPVIDERGILLPIAGEFAGQHIKKARGAIVEKLQKKGLVVKVDETYVHNIPTAERTGGIIEPQIKLQWFVDVNKPVEARGGKSLKELMREPVENGDIKILPIHFEKVYYHWIDNLRDWCISRQIWFGHRIPVWYRGEETYVGVDAPAGDGWEQDPDVLDTWFSSRLWTLSTLGWPEETQDLQTYHPTSLIESGYDIIFQWIAGMILMSQFFRGEVPFKNVYFHGIVRDGQGRKISKSLGNNIDPLDMGAKYGMDAVRVSLIAGMAPGTDSKVSEEKIRGYKHFANKIWNIARFVLESRALAGEAQGDLHPDDVQVVGEARAAAAEATKQLEKYRLDLAFDTLYQFVWSRFADEVLEESKPLLKGEDKARAASRAEALYQSLQIILKVLHPFMPFVTEEIWDDMPDKKDLLMVEKWPGLR